MSSCFIATSSSAASSPIASKSPGMPILSGKPDSKMSVKPSSFDTASASQVRLKDAYLGGLMEEQRGDPSHQEEEDSEDSDNPAAGIWYYEEEPVAQNNKAWGKPPLHTEPILQLTWKVKRILKRHGYISPDTSHHMETVFSMVSKIYGKQPGDPMEYLNVNLAFW